MKTELVVEIVKSVAKKRSHYNSADKNHSSVRYERTLNQIKRYNPNHRLSEEEKKNKKKLKDKEAIGNGKPSIINIEPTIDTFNHSR